MFREKQEQIETTGGALNQAGATDQTTVDTASQQPAEHIITDPAHQQSVETTANNPDPASSEPETLPADVQRPRNFEEMLNSNRDFRSEFDRRINQALNTARRSWERQQKADRDEAARLAGMNETQRREYELERDRAALDAERAAFARQQLQVTVGTELQKRGLSADFAPWLTGEDADSSQANINRFEAMWNASVTAAMNARMRADAPPRDPKPAVDYSKMSDEEYYASVLKRKE